MAAVMSSSICAQSASRIAASQKASTSRPAVGFSQGVSCWERSFEGVQMGGARGDSSRVVMGNPNAGKGVFAPIVVLTRNVVGTKKFNQLRGKGIALHSQVITEFCKSIGADAKQRQGLIRLAKKNGERLGFLA